MSLDNIPHHHLHLGQFIISKTQCFVWEVRLMVYVELSVSGRFECNGIWEITEQGYIVGSQ